MWHEVIEKIAKAIKRQEGFRPGTRAYRNNNPGNLRDQMNKQGKWRFWPTLPHDSQGFPRFPTLEDGETALRKDISLKINRRMTLQQLIFAWAPPIENKTDTYLVNVALWTGLPTDVPLIEIIRNWEKNSGSTTAG